MKPFFAVCVMLLSLISTCVPRQGKALVRKVSQKTLSVISAEERVEILNTLRTGVEKQLGLKVKFIVQTTQRVGDWVLIQVKPVQLNGSDIDYKTTAYYKENRERIDDGLFDDHVLALLKNEKGKWRIMDYEMGNTDFSGEYWEEKHGLLKLFKNE